MRKLLYVILLLLFRLLMFPGAVCAEILSLPDSLITDDNVYKYTFSDFDKAQQVMEQLRKRKSLSMFRMDVVEGDLYFNVGQYYKALKFYKRGGLPSAPCTPQVCQDSHPSAAAGSCLPPVP